MSGKMMTCNFPLLSMFDKILTTAKRRQQWTGFCRQTLTRTRPGVCERAMYRFGDISYEI